MDRQRRIEVYRQTFDIVRKNGYEVNGKKITLPREDDERMQQGTVFYDKEFHVEAPTINGHTDVRVVNEDCLVAAKELIDEGYHVAVLNMASRRNPGGGVTGGSGAQEENLSGGATTFCHSISLRLMPRSMESGNPHINIHWTVLLAVSTPPMRLSSVIPRQQITVCWNSLITCRLSQYRRLTVQNLTEMV